MPLRISFYTGQHPSQEQKQNLALPVRPYVGDTLLSASIMRPDEGTDLSVLNARIDGPFKYKSAVEMQELLGTFLESTGLQTYKTCFLKGMQLSQDRTAFDHERTTFDHERTDGLGLRLKLNDEEEELLKFEDVPSQGFDKSEYKRSWTIDSEKLNRVPRATWQLFFLCALGAMAQGWDESVLNSAQIFYQEDFTTHDKSPDKAHEKSMLEGLVFSAPYLACIVGCWLTPWLNRHLGRRGTIFFTAIFSTAFALAQAFANTWQSSLILRFLMGLGIGPRSATFPIYAAECSPTNSRGTLVVLLQLFNATGAFFGFLACLIFRNIRSSCSDNLLPLEFSLRWRLTLASTMVVHVVLATFIYTQSESPRWLISEGHRLRLKGLPSLAKARYAQAWNAMKHLQHQRVQAAKEMFKIYHFLEIEIQEVYRRQSKPNSTWFRKSVLELFADRRNRRALVASLVCMIVQQTCGVYVFHLL